MNGIVLVFATVAVIANAVAYVRSVRLQRRLKRLIAEAMEIAYRNSSLFLRRDEQDVVDDPYVWPT